VQPATEVWVTEPDLHQIEVFKPGATAATAPSSTGTIAVPDGPESLEIDADHKRAFTHATAATVEIDVTSHAVTQSWPNGCTNSRGIAVDSANGWVMSACEEGRVVVLDTNSGATIGTVSVGAGVDQITYDTKRTRLYVPGAASSSTSVVQLAANGSPTAKGAVSTSSDAHCAVTGGAGQVFVCSPAQGALLFVNDPF
jgi:DNA-binding beta-propeller fold protein YncE